MKYSPKNNKLIQNIVIPRFKSDLDNFRYVTKSHHQGIMLNNNIPYNISMFVFQKNKYRKSPQIIGKTKKFTINDIRIILFLFLIICKKASFFIFSKLGSIINIAAAIQIKVENGKPHVI